MNKQKHIIIIGSGIGGLASACLLSKKGYKVTILEKNDMPGGRASLIVKDTDKGKFIFDKGPSWYMMPDVFEDFFKVLGEDINEHLELQLLSPSYRVFQQGDGFFDFFADLEKNKETFESLEKGSGEVLEKFLSQTKFQYEVAKQEFMYKNYDSIFDFFNKRVMTLGRKLPIFSKQSTIINKLFKNDLLQKVMQYQTVLLGTSPYDTPGIYTLMNYVDFGLGVWYPKGGLYEVTKAFVNIAEKNGTEIKVNSPVKKININNGNATGVTLENGTIIDADMVISNADYHHTEQVLVEEEKYREHSQKYWDKRTLAPSAFIMYLGIDGKIPTLSHHNLFFPKTWKENFDQIFKHPTWPGYPALYVCAPSKSDDGIAPDNTENIFVLVPIAAALSHTEEEKELYADKILSLMEKELDIPNLKERILTKEIYSVDNFIKDYNAFKGTALGLAHTLPQTAIFRPNNISKKVENLFFVGAGTNPGIGVPICLISAELVYKRIEKISDPEPLKEV